MRVMILDLDSADSVDRLRSALEQGGHRVDVVTRARSAAWLAQDASVALVLVCTRRLDDEVASWCRALRAGGHWVPVAVLLDAAAPHEIVDVLDAGADDVVTRPVRLVEITARARALVRRAVQERPADLLVGDLRLDPAAHRVWRAEDEIQLTPQEFSLLEVLMRNAGRVLTRDLLLDSAWTSQDDPASNIVDQYVGRLRRRIDAPYRRTDLETVRGVGYRLRTC